MRKLLLAPLILLTINMLGQKDTSETALGVGYSLGVNRSFLQYELSSQFVEGVTDQFTTSTINSWGLSAGVTFDYDWSPTLTQRLTIGAVINQAQIEFQFSEDLPVAKHVFPIAIQAATYFDYKLGQGKTQPKIVGGIGLLVRNGDDTDEVPDMESFDIHLKLGIGALLYRPKTRLNFDLLYSHSARNLLMDSDQIHNQALGILQKHYITLIFHGY